MYLCCAQIYAHRKKWMYKHQKNNGYMWTVRMWAVFFFLCTSQFSEIILEGQGDGREEKTMVIGKPVFVKKGFTVILELIQKSIMEVGDIWRVFLTSKGNTMLFCKTQMTTLSIFIEFCCAQIVFICSISTTP